MLGIDFLRPDLFGPVTSLYVGLVLTVKCVSFRGRHEIRPLSNSLRILCHVMFKLEESVTFVDAQETSGLKVFVVVRFEIVTVVNIQVTVWFG